MSPDKFIAAIAEPAQVSMRTTRIPASFTLAEAALESAWGASRLTLSACNLFGVKADRSWRGPTVPMDTTEYVNGKPVRLPAQWRQYPDWLSCIQDHAVFLTQNPRYAECFQHVGGEAFARAVQAAGYATDPAYADKIISIMRGHGLADFDKGVL